jgi:hypothetical protein
MESWALVFYLTVGTSFPQVETTDGFPDHQTCQAAGRQLEEAWARWKTKRNTVRWICIYKGGNPPVVPLQREPKE